VVKKDNDNNEKIENMTTICSWRKKRNILLVCLLLFSLNIFGQDLRLLNTEELIEISEKRGLDSALLLIEYRPIFHIDKETAEQLAKHAKFNNPSDRIEKFLVDYSLCLKQANHSEILHDYFDRKKDQIKEYFPDRFGGLPRISQNSIFALIENSNNQTESLLISYYELWNEKSAHYKQDYESGIEAKDWRQKEKLMSPYEDCNHNCYVIQLFLKMIESKFYDETKQDEHKEKQKYYWRGGFSLGKNDDCSRYIQNRDTKSIELTKNYTSIGDIDFDNEIGLERIFNHYDKAYCWKFLIYNNKNGYLDLGCQWDVLAGHGVFYKLELKENLLIIHELYTWIS
jgi:hypothetical protein